MRSKLEIDGWACSFNKIRETTHSFQMASCHGNQGRILRYRRRVVHSLFRGARAIDVDRSDMKPPMPNGMVFVRTRDSH